ncbi:MAG: translation initiation factor IF-2 [Anaerolineae bacterium]|nr:translation initiation factor IF-2 [Anaerolineae bacterium]
MAKDRSKNATRRGGNGPTPATKPQGAQARRAPGPAGGSGAAPGTGANGQTVAPAAPSVIELPSSLTVRDLGHALGVSPIDVMKKLIGFGIMANINELIDYDTAAIVAAEMGFETREQKAEEEKAPEVAPTQLPSWRDVQGERPEDLRPRPPVVTVMGHVDHGKTSLLDAIRNTNVVEGEAGGITQHIGAYQVELQGKKITFLDTPGHEAFTAMRARGAQATDIVVLVVAADDGVQPQTKEAIAHARAAQVPIVVALNKIDKPEANPEVVKRQLADLGLLVEEWGGNVICVPVSAKKRLNIEELLENILLVAEVAELKANPFRAATGVVVESRLDKTRGPVATLLVQRGTLRVGDNLVIGEIAGRVRAMFDDKGRPVSEATPSMPVMILGLSDVPRAGDLFEVVEDERTAKAIAAERAQQRQQAAAARPARVTLEEVFARMQEGKAKELNIILKADVQGSLEPIESSLQKLGTEDLKVKILHSAIGNIGESDVMLASASSAIVIGFNVSVDAAARALAEQEGVDIRLYNVIYQLVEDVEKALSGMLEPTYKEVVTGHAEVRAVFSISKRGKVAGCYMTDGQVTRASSVRVIRGGQVLFDGKIASLKRFTEDVKEVNAGFEFGIGLEKYDDFQVGDVLEFYKQERV